MTHQPNCSLSAQREYRVDGAFVRVVVTVEAPLEHCGSLVIRTIQAIMEAERGVVTED